MFFSRYMLSLGLPFERWLHELADNMQREEQPETFLAQSLEGMTRLPWVNGCEWQVPRAARADRDAEGQRSEFQHGLLRLAIFTQQPLSPALNWHFNLLVQLLGEFYEAKLRARRAAAAQLRQGHPPDRRAPDARREEPPAVAQRPLPGGHQRGRAPSPEYQALLRRQLPVIAQRLQQTMDKLRRPELEGAQLRSRRAVVGRLAGALCPGGVSFSAERASIRSNPMIPATLFNSAAENLLENALAKKQEAPPCRSAWRSASIQQPTLTVCDDGQAIPAEVSGNPVPRAGRLERGLGIGLYQTARHAEFYGYELRVAVQ
jgi:hypothetical protein